MSAETHAYRPIPEPELTPNQFELFTPRDEQGQRIGRGVIFERRRTQPGKDNNGILKTIIRTAIRYGRAIQEPENTKEQQALKDVRSQLLAQLQAQHETSQVYQWANNYEDGLSHVTDEERAKRTAK